MSGNGRTQLLSRGALADYRPRVHGAGLPWRDHRGPTLLDLEKMRQDPRVRLGLRVIKAPISTVKWQVTASSQGVADWVDRTLKKVWAEHLSRLLLAVDYGSVAAESVWAPSEETGLLELADLRYAHPSDVRPLELDGRPCGFRVRSLPGDGRVLPPRSLHLVLEPEWSPYYGRSRVLGAWEPWSEKSERHGAREVRRTWYLKNATRGGVMRHPLGMVDLGDGVSRSCQGYAAEIMERWESNGILVLPNAFDSESGKFLWDYEHPQAMSDIKGVNDYVKDLDAEIFEGMEIPTEVVQAAESGGSWAGRTVPFVVFLTAEDAIAAAVLRCLERDALKPGVDANFGEGARFKVTPKSLVPPDEEKEAKGQEGQGGLAGLLGGGQEQEQEGQEAERMSVVRLAATASDWKPYLGKRGANKGKQVGWVNASGRVVYGAEKPGSRSAAAAAAREQARAAKPTVESVTAQAKTLLADKKRLTPESVLGLIDGLLGLKLAEMRQVRQALGGESGGKSKSELAKKVAAKVHEALSGEPAEKQAPAPEKKEKRAPKKPEPKVEPQAPEGPTPPSPPTKDFAPALGEAFDRLDREGGGYNQVSLEDLRKALPHDRATFDAELRRLRESGQYSLAPAEGRARSLTSEERAAGIEEDGVFLLYLSRRQPPAPEKPAAAKPAAPEEPAAAPAPEQPAPPTKSEHGQAGAAHPLAGLDRKAQERKLADAASGQSGTDDPLGLAAAGFPDGVDRKAFADDVAGVLARHAQEHGGTGASTQELYEAVGAKHGLSKHDFLRAVTALHDDRSLKLSGWSKAIPEIPDPELIGAVGSKLMAYVNPPSAVASDPAALEAQAGRGDPALNTRGVRERRGQGAPPAARLQAIRQSAMANPKADNTAEAAQAVAELKALKTDELKQVAKDLGVTRPAKSKVELLKAIELHLTEPFRATQSFEV